MGFKPRLIGCGVIATLLLFTAIFAVQSAYAKTILDTDLIFEDSQPIETINERLVRESDAKTTIDNTDEQQHWLVKSYHRIKRQVKDLLSPAEKKLVKKEKKKNDNLNKPKKFKNKKNSTRTELPKKETLRPKRKYDDDEDNDELSGSGDLPDRNFRLKMSIAEEWNPLFKDRNSEEYLNLAATIRGGVEEIIHHEFGTGNQVFVQVVNIIENSFTVVDVTVDIFFDRSISKHTLEQVFRNAAQYYKIGEHITLADPEIEFRAMEGTTGWSHTGSVDDDTTHHQDGHEEDEEDDEEEEDLEDHNSHGEHYGGHNGGHHGAPHDRYNNGHHDGHHNSHHGEEPDHTEQNGFESDYENENENENNGDHIGHNTGHHNGDDNGDEDGDETEDEEDNSFFQCLPHQLYCNDGSCYDQLHKCDGIQHCADNTDELECEEYEQPTHRPTHVVNNHNHHSFRIPDDRHEDHETDDQHGTPDEHGNEHDPHGHDPHERNPHEHDPDEHATDDHHRVPGSHGRHETYNNRNEYDPHEHVTDESNMGHETYDDRNEHDPHGHERNPHEHDAHERDPHERDPHEQDPHEQDPHEQDPHEQDPHEQDPHEQDPHEQDPHEHEPHEHETDDGHRMPLDHGAHRGHERDENIQSVHSHVNHEAPVIHPLYPQSLGIVCDEFYIPCDNQRECYLQSSQCDDFADCSDHSDEKGCDSDNEIDQTNTEDQIQNGDHTTDHNRPEHSNNTHTHHPDEESELEHEGDCQSDEFQCATGDCIHHTYQCDGIRHCLDNSDEENCNNHGEEPQKSCEADQFMCSSGACISLALACDYSEDCSDGSDEVDCCAAGTFKCHHDHYTQCIEAYKTCDNHTDCDDGSDEFDCGFDHKMYCEDNQFHCSSGECVELSLQCNNHNDCHDGSDELNCDEECAQDQFACHSGTQCIPLNRHCDEYPDCLDRSDELNCEADTARPPYVDGGDHSGQEHPVMLNCRGDDRLTCGGEYASQFICGVQKCDGVPDCPNGEDERDCAVCDSNEFSCDILRCIQNSKRCDGKVDCQDGTDEHDCPPVTPSPPQACDRRTEFRCNSGKCIPIEYKCNEEYDCETGEDEEHCPCSSEEFTCHNGDCINADHQCDHIEQCADGSDEFDCKDYYDKCQSEEFLCDDYTCLPQSNVCDGYVDCSDGTDEVGCKNRTVECSDDHFQCDIGLCVRKDDRCNGKRDCVDGTDELKCENCHVGAFHCHDGECISEDKRCDGIHDCGDLSDETTCRQCHPHQFTCNNGLCLDSRHVCDGVNNCPDGSDESICHEVHKCEEDEFMCVDECFKNYKKCDGYPDCRDHSDEHGCAVTEPPAMICPELQCDGEEVCYSHHEHCDGHRNCRDGSDEENCECKSGEYRCENGVCIQEYLKCDGKYDCSDGSDEADCPVECHPDEWTCADGNCIPEHAKCNGRFDCPDRSDEAGCSTPAPPRRCRFNEFTCTSGQCVPNSALCNGIPECSDYSDERDCNDPKPTRPPHPPQPSDGRLNLKTYPDSQIIKERREVVFQCRDEGPLRARVEWKRASGRPLPPDSKDINGRLEIPNIRVEHAGDYICEAVGYPRSTPGNSVTVNLDVEKYDPIRPPSACGSHEATCMNGDCIPKHKICDKQYDCVDGSDESGCVKLGGCEPNEFKCDNNKCILKIWRCDGEKDCEDNSDEESCATLPPGSQCRHDEFKCYDGQCVPKSFHCDKQSDCADNSDEIGCTIPSVITRPPAFVELRPGETFNITCYATGVPVPLIAWRLNWGHIPDKCFTSSNDGFGILTCHNVEKKDSGAYSCEIINTMGSTIVSPDTILVVSDNTSYCDNGLFNSQATSQSDCINCFCFGVSNQCSSADLFTYSLPPPVKSLNVVGVTLPSFTIGDYSAKDLVSTQHGIQLRYSNLPVTKQQPFYSLPPEYLGNQLKSYGGSLRYELEYFGDGDYVDSPDIIMTGNKQFLIFHADRELVPNERHQIIASFTPGHWHRVDGSVATRQEIMMALANIDHLLIKLQYVTIVQRTVELLHIDMDSAGSRDFGLGSASLVEECRCPEGYSGLSCESCAHGYMRQDSGLWLGRCVQIPMADNCPSGQYGSPSRGIPCKLCPCPLTNSGNTCKLGADGYVVCNCKPGYVGRRCESCAPGYFGDPMTESCEPEPVIHDHCSPDGTDHKEFDRCICKPNVQGEYCDECKARSFHLTDKSATGCIECFCSGLPQDCRSSSWYRDSVQISFTNRRAEPLAVVIDYENPNPDVAPNRINVDNSELVLTGFSSNDNEVYYWSLPSRFLGDKVTAYGGDLNYTVRYMAPPGGYMSPNNAPDVVIISANDIVILHYRKDPVSPSGPSTYSLPMWEDGWQTLHGQHVDRAHFLMSLSDVQSILIKATYTTITEEAALSQVSLSVATEHQSGSNIRAVEVEQCSCPEGYIGLSCEDCASGYKRAESGNYLAFCEPCECNGHSRDCDSETGVCNNCEHNTVGRQCDSCASGYSGNATSGSPYDCQETDAITGCRNCDSRGGACDIYGRCICKQNVVGNSCNQCREGSYNLDARNPDGCSECFCSGATKVCSASRLYREQIPMIIFQDKFTITNEETKQAGDGQVEIEYANNELSYRFENDLPSSLWYWNLPARFLGNQILSYGGNLTISQRTEGYGPFTSDIDIILVGTHMSLSYKRDHYHDGAYSVQLVEDNWMNADTGSVYPVSRSDLLSVLGNLESILVRASLKDRTDAAHVSDIALDTAVTHRTEQAALLVEECRCPSGYRGSSCESCEEMHYRDTYDRSAGLSGVCKPCQCSENADGCSMSSDGHVTCHCKPGYFGDYCDTRPGPTRPPVHQKPNITVTVSSPSLQIIEAGETIRITCTGVLLNATPINVKWLKVGGTFSHRTRDEQGILTIIGSHVDDSGTYQCRAQSGREVVSRNVSIVVEVRGEERPTVSLNAPYIDENEYDPAEIVCTATGNPSPTLSWVRLNGRMPSDVTMDGGYLRFNSLRKADEGEYRCLASNSAGTGDQLLIVYVKDTPTHPETEIVQIEPHYFNGNPGDDVMLTCSSSLYRNIVWSKEGSRSLPFSVHVSGDVLIIQNAQVEDSGTYICTTTSPQNRPYTTEVVVYIKASTPSGTVPVITQFPESHTISEGTDYTLVCHAKGDPTPTIRWSMHPDNFQRNVIESGNTLRIINAQPNNRGIYICIAENEIGTDESNTRIEIEAHHQYEAPTVELHPRDPQSIRIGDPVMITCRVVAGMPSPTLTWRRRDGHPLSSRFRQEYAGTLELDEAQIEDAGEYECRAENAAGSVTVSTVITVQYAPTVTLSPNTSHMELYEGDHLQIDCYGKGGPTPVLTWHTPNDHGDMPLHSPSALNVHLPSQITIERRRATTRDAGRYECHATNEVGRETAYIDVFVKIRGDIPVYTDRPTHIHPAPQYLDPYYFLINDTSTLTCDVSGSYRETTWRRADGRHLPYEARIHGNKLIIERTHHDAAGTYECVIDDGYNPPFAAVIVELVLIDAPRITFTPQMPIRVNSGDNVDIDCNAEGQQPIRVLWHAENNRPFPRSVRVDGSKLHFSHITIYDAGKYYCFASNVHGNVTKLAQVLVYPNEVVPQPEDNSNRIREVIVGDTLSLDCNYAQQRGIVNVKWYRLHDELPRQSAFDGDRLVLRKVNIQDAGKYYCEIRFDDGRSTEDYVQVNVNRDHRLPHLKLEPSISNLIQGDSLEVECISTDGVGSIITWETHDGGRLPYNFRQIGNRLVMTDVELENSGRYVCKCNANDGETYTSEYELNIEEHNQKKHTKPKIEYAEVGSNVILRCHTGHYPTKYLWSRPTGPLPSGQDYTNNELNLKNVQAKDAGFYVCTAMHSGESIDLETILVVTGAIPHFPQAPKSYMVLPKIEDAYMRFNFEITFKPERPNGLILYNGQRRGGGDYIALSLNESYVEFRFDFGFQPTILRAEKPITLREWHTVKVNRIRKDGFMIVDDQPAVSIPSSTRFQGLELNENMYLGGVPKFEDIASTATEFKEGFVGCISRLVLRDRVVELNEESIYVEGTTSCEPCADDPCANEGVCLEAQTENGYACVCMDGFTGKNCATEGYGCLSSTCGTGRCLELDVGIQCLCPLNKTGDRCQYIEHLDEENLSFRDGSFAAYKTPKATKMNIKFRIRPENLNDSVVLYIAESDTSNGDFAAVVIKDKHVEFRFVTGAKLEPAIIRSRYPIEAHKWTDIIISRRHGEGALQVGSEPQITGKLIGPARSMYLKTHLYIGGYDKRNHLNTGVGISRGFDGCISGLEVSSLPVNMIADILDGVNVQNCGQIVEPEIPAKEICRPGFGGKNCEIIIDVCFAQNPCENGGLCKAKKGLEFNCDCPLGFTGDVCQHSIKIEIAGHFRGDGFIELDRDAISNGTTQGITGVAVLFSTSHTDGILVWYGQNKGEYYKGQDFVSLAVVNGFVEFSFRLNGEESVIHNPTTRVDDGFRHVAIIKREGNQASLELDYFTMHGQCRPTDRKEAFIPGHLFIGGAPDLGNFTGNRYTHGFNGCVHIVEPLNGGSINFTHKAISALNVDNCPLEDEIDLGTEPPAV